MTNKDVWDFGGAWIVGDTVIVVVYNKDTGIIKVQQKHIGDDTA